MKPIKKGLIFCLLLLTAGFFLLPVFSVHAAEDLTELTASRDAATTAITNQATYETNSYTAFFQSLTDLGGIAGITAVINANTVTQVEADALQVSIDAALAGLITVNTYNATQALYGTAAALDLMPYTPNSQTLYTNELARIHTILINPTAGETAILALQNDLSQADDLLVLKASTNALSVAGNQAVIAYYDDRNDYTISSHEDFRTAVNAYGNYLYVNAVLADPNVTQATVDQLTSSVFAALLLLVRIADVTLLQMAYDAQLAVDVSANTPQSISLYQAELERIHLILISDDTNQTLCDQSITDLQNAESLLVAKADKSALLALKTAAEDYNPDVYSVTSYYILAALLATTTTMLADDNVSQAAVDQMITDINLAITGLKKNTDELQLVLGNTGLDVNDFITLGTSAVLSYVSSNPAIASVDANGLITPVDFGHCVISVTLANGVIETIPVFVKENVTPVTLIIISTIPVVSTALAVGLILVRSRPVEIVQRISNQKSKKQKKSAEASEEPEPKAEEPVTEPLPVAPEPVIEPIPVQAETPIKKPRKKTVKETPDETKPTPVVFAPVVLEQAPLEEPEMVVTPAEPTKSEKKAAKKS